MPDESPEVAQVDALVDTAIAAFADVEEEEWLSWGADIMPLQAEALAERVAARKAKEEEEREAERVRQEEAQKAEEAARLAEATEIVTDRLLSGLISADDLDSAVATEVRALEMRAREGSEAPSPAPSGFFEGEIPKPDPSVANDTRKRRNRASVEIPVDKKPKESKGKKSERPFASLLEIPVNEVRNTSLSSTRSFSSLFATLVRPLHPGLQKAARLRRYGEAAEVRALHDWKADLPVQRQNALPMVCGVVGADGCGGRRGGERGGGAGAQASSRRLPRYVISVFLRLCFAD